MRKSLSSLCKITSRGFEIDNSLYRIADLRDGKFEKFNRNLDSRSSYNRYNRQILYAPPQSISESNEIAIWDWSISPNRRDRTKDHVDSNLVHDLHPVLVVEKSHDKKFEIPEDFPFAYFILFYDKEVGTGLLCTKDQIDGNHLKKSVTTLPEYKISALSFISIENICWVLPYPGEIFLEKFSPVAQRNIRKIPDVVRSCLIPCLSWRKVKEVGDMYKVEWQNARKLLSLLPQQDVISSIREKCACDEKTAEKYLFDFIKNVDNWDKQNRKESQALQELVDVHPEIFEKLEAKIKEKKKAEFKKFEEEYFQKLEKSKAENLKEIEDIRKQTENVKAKYKGRQKQLELLEREVSLKEESLTNLDTAFQQKIEKVKNDVSSFMVDRIFMQSGSAFSAAPAVSRYKPGALVTDCTTAESQDDFFDAVGFNLELAGVNAQSEYLKAVAKFLFAAFRRKQPLLFAGPNGEAIADAFSVSLFGKKAGRYDCSESSIDESEMGDDEVVVLSGVLFSKDISPVTSLIQKRNRFYIITTPCKEDLCLEPEGLFAYMLPVITDVFVTQISEDSFEKVEYDFSRIADCRINGSSFTRMLEKIGDVKIPLFTCSRMEQIFELMKALSEKGSESFTAMSYFVLVFPYLFATGQLSLLNQYLKKKSDKSELYRNIYSILKPYMVDNP